MISCTKATKLLIKQASDALEEKERMVLKAHIAACPQCSLEQERLQGLLARVSDQTRPEGMTRAEARDLMNAVNDRLSYEKQTWKAGPSLLKRPLVLVPAAAACAGLAVALLLTSQISRTTVPPDSSLRSSAQVEQQDLDVIQNLDLLQDLETIQKLVSITHEDEHSESSSSQSRIRHDIDEKTTLV
jgi:anti-sigma factor RsiW